MQKLTRSVRDQLVPNGAQRTGIKLANAARNSFITVIGKATVTVTVATATALLNRGSVFALAEEIVLDENGTERSICTGKALRFASEMSAPSALTAARLPAVLAVGVYEIEEAARVHFAHPLSNNPMETTFVEKDQRQSFNFVVKRVADPAAMLATAGPATVVVSNVRFNVIQGFEKPDARGIVAPIFLPTIRQQTIQVNGTVAKLPMYLETTNLIRMIVLSQEVAGVEVGDIIKRVGFRGDYREIIQGMMDLNDIILDSEFDFGGAVYASNKSHIGWNFQRYGQLAETLNPAQDVNLRFELDVAVSARAGQSEVRATIFELTRDPAVTAPTIPFRV